MSGRSCPRLARPSIVAAASSDPYFGNAQGENYVLTKAPRLTTQKRCVKLKLQDEVYVYD